MASKLGSDKQAAFKVPSMLNRCKRHWQKHANWVTDPAVQFQAGKDDVKMFWCKVATLLPRLYNEHLNEQHMA